MSFWPWFLTAVCVSLVAVVFVLALRSEDRKEYYKESDDDNYGC